MMPRKRDLCPRCGGELYVVEHSQRTTPGGVYYTKRCVRCTYVADGFKPRRTKRH